MATNDRGLCALLAGVVVVYLWFWPRDFYAFDEGLFLYESKRLLDGDVFYRDIFEILTPGAFYVMALFFRVFGTTIATAKTVMAIVHASIAVLIYLIARRAGTRRSLALTAAGSRLPALSAVAAIVLSGVVLLRLGAIALETLQGRAKLYSLSHQTAAGVVDFRNPAEIKLLEAVVERTGPGDELFAYPSYPGIYFLSGTKNPTRFQILLRNYHEPTHFQEAIDVLEKRRVRFVVLQPFGTWPKKDPFVQYLRRAYTSVRVPFSRRFPGFALLERKDGAASSAPLSPLGDPPPMD